MPEPDRAGGIHGADVSFDGIRADVLAAAGSGAWEGELAILRVTQDELLIRFTHVKERASATRS